jgi:hypothetical protein
LGLRTLTEATQTINLADDPAYAKTRVEMAALLQAGWKAALPPELKK